MIFSFSGCSFYFLKLQPRLHLYLIVIAYVICYWVDIMTSGKFSVFWICIQKGDTIYKNIDRLMQAWKHWINGTSSKLLDPSLRDSYSTNEVIRCIHIGLLCVQENPAKRPTMASINLMLNSHTITMPTPQKPTFFRHRRTEPNMP